jgi:hypothetical protein
MRIFGRRQMMKKVLVLLLIFALASVASAALQISAHMVGGGEIMGPQGPVDPFNPQDSEIVLHPSEEIWLDIWTNADIVPGEGEGYWALAVLPTEGQIFGGIKLLEDGTIYDGSIAYTAPLDGVWGGLSLANMSLIPAGEVIFDQIIFHCEAPGDATIVLLRDIFSNPVEEDRLVIHQVPEPMTIALLGLGGLFLRRRK